MTNRLALLLAALAAALLALFDAATNGIITW